MLGNATMQIRDCGPGHLCHKGSNEPADARRQWVTGASRGTPLSPIRDQVSQSSREAQANDDEKSPYNNPFNDLPYRGQLRLGRVLFFILGHYWPSWTFHHSPLTCLHSGQPALPGKPPKQPHRAERETQRDKPKHPMERLAIRRSHEDRRVMAERKKHPISPKRQPNHAKGGDYPKPGQPARSGPCGAGAGQLAQQNRGHRQSKDGRQPNPYPRPEWPIPRPGFPFPLPHAPVGLGLTKDRIR